jgi:hypothetical protein
LVGHAAAISAGEWITASGDWVNDRTHGQQFKARFLKTSTPTSVDGIEKYLASGMIRGIGPVYAKKLLNAFGDKVFDIIEAQPDRLREVDGIGPVRAGRIIAAWAEQKVVREIMVFLHSHGVGTARAVRIYKTYGADAVQVMSENPYRLARDIRGIGFKTADAIAMKLGVDKTALVRVRAGISYALIEAMDEGHCGLPTEELVPLAEQLLDVPQDLIRTALDLELADSTVIANRVGDNWLACTGRSAASLTGSCNSGTASCPGRGLIRTRRYPGSSSGPVWYSPKARDRRLRWRSPPRYWSSPAGPASARRPWSKPSSAFSRQRTQSFYCALRLAAPPSA